MKKLFTNRDINMELRMRLLRCYVFFHAFVWSRNMDSKEKPHGQTTSLRNVVLPQNMAYPLDR